MSLPEIGFIPRIEAATIGNARFDLSRMAGVRAYKSGVSEAGTVNVSSYLTGGGSTSYGLSKVESFV